jgi:hypothetical protein
MNYISLSRRKTDGNKDPQFAQTALARANSAIGPRPSTNIANT